ncbi:MAG TPA: DUF1552 domain-containing protein [Kofleriaceae bacterium]|nr:DUF1552 domain-containing protein [Kofleriaceae bacterium]
MSKLSRRELVKRVGLAALFSPFLSLVKRAPASAAPLGKANYLLVFYTNGTDPAAWTPAGSTADNLVLSAMTEPLAPLRSNLVLVEKLSSMGTADNHAAPGGLTGQGYSGQTRISIDQFISDRLRSAGVVTPIPNLILGSVKTEQQTSFYRDNQPLSPIFSPLAAYDAIFGAVGGGASPNLVRRRKSSLDLVQSELKQLSDQLGGQERQKLELHAASIRAVESRLEPGGAGACASGPRPAEPSQDLLASVTHLELAITAFACDITRVASVQFGHHQNTQVSLTEVGNPGNWHNDFIHGDNPRTRLTNLERWLAQQFVAAATKLKSLPAPTGGGTLFDQTLMVWARDMGDAVGHNGNDMRFVFSGGAGGFLVTSPNGRYIDGGGQAHQRALTTCAAAMGITDLSGFGDVTQSRLPLETIGK